MNRTQHPGRPPHRFEGDEDDAAEATRVWEGHHVQALNLAAIAPVLPQLQVWRGRGRWGQLEQPQAFGAATAGAEQHTVLRRCLTLLRRCLQLCRQVSWSTRPAAAPATCQTHCCATQLPSPSCAKPFPPGPLCNRRACLPRTRGAAQTRRRLPAAAAPRPRCRTMSCCCCCCRCLLMPCHPPPLRRCLPPRCCCYRRCLPAWRRAWQPPPPPHHCHSRLRHCCCCCRHPHRCSHPPRCCWPPWLPLAPGRAVAPLHHCCCCLHLGCGGAAAAKAKRKLAAGCGLLRDGCRRGEAWIN